MDRVFSGLAGNLYYWHHLALLSRTQEEKILTTTLTQIGLIINKGKTKILKDNTTTVDLIKLEGEALGEVEAFICLGSVVDKLGGTDTDVKARTGKGGRAAFLQLKKIWKALTLQIKVKQLSVQLVLLYGAETWRTTVAIMKKMQTLTPICKRSSGTTAED